MSKTVNFIEAINSGKRFRIVSEDGTKSNFYEVEDGLVKSSWSKNVLECYLPTINSKFELEEKSITITESEFEDAIKLAISSVLDGAFHSVAIRDSKKELGF